MKRKHRSNKKRRKQPVRTFRRKFDIKRLRRLWARFYNYPHDAPAIRREEGQRKRMETAANTLLPLLIVGILFSMMLSLDASASSKKSLKEMSYEEAVKKYRALGKVEPFLESETARKYPRSLNQFFDSAIYEKLVGNEFFGFYHDEGVKYQDQENRIAVDTIAAIKGRGYEKYKEQYTKIFLETLNAHKKYTYTIDRNARYSIGICIVSVKEKSDRLEPVGLVLETYIKDRVSKKHFYHRCPTGSSGSLDEAMRLSCARIICNLEYLKKKGGKENAK